MPLDLDRRRFIGTAAALLAARAVRAQEPFMHSLKKAVIVGRPTEENLTAIRAAGFDGVEAGIIPPDEAAAAKTIADGLGVRIHSVLRGWAEFNSDDAAKVAETEQVTADALRAAAGYGADAVLLVPCRVGGMAMPEAWEFRIEFDPDTGHLTRCAEGDNARYADYLRAQNTAWDRSLQSIARLVPVAEECGVVIAVENVWNNLWVDPTHFAAFVDACASPWVRAYFDIGNHVKYSPPQDWIRALGERIVKIHVKDFKLNENGQGGEFVNIRDGSVEWPAVRRALDEVGYDGWCTIEGGNVSLEEHSQRLDDILAGR